MAPRDPQIVYSIEENGFKKPIATTTDDKNEVTFEDALNTIAFGKMHIFIIILSGLTLMSVLNETMGMAFIMPSSQCDLQLTSTDKGFLSAVSFLGIFLSSHLWGYLADTRGRRKVIIYTTLVSNIFTVISCFARDFWPFLVLRLLSGFFISGPSATVYAYLGEFTGQKYRATIISLACMFVGLSAVYLPVTGYFILGGDWSIYIYEGMYFRPWRLLLMTYAIPGFISALFLLKMKESPKFLVAQGRTDESLAVLKWLYNKNTGKSEDSFPIRSIKSELDQDYEDNIKNSGACSVIRSMWNQTIPLLKRPHILYFLVLCLIQMCVFMVSGGLGLWYAEILNSLATSTNNVGSLCAVISPKTVTITAVNIALDNKTLYEYGSVCTDTIADRTFFDGMIIGGLYILGFMIISSTIKVLGRGIILAFCLLLSSAAGLAIQFIEHSTVNVVLFSAFIMFSGVAISVINGTAVDLFPTHLRAMSVCIVLMCGRLGSIMGTNIVGQLLEYNCALTFYLFAGIMFVYKSSGGLGLWYAEILNSLATSTDSNIMVCDAITPKYVSRNQTGIVNEFVACNDVIAEDTFFNGAILGLLYICGYLLISFTIKPVGRKIILSTCFIISTTACVAMQFIENSTINVILFSMFLMFAGITVSIITGTAVDIFPTHLRAMAVCIVLMCGRLGSIFGTNLVGQLLMVYCSATFYIFAGIIFACACLTVILPS